MIKQVRVLVLVSVLLSVPWALMPQDLTPRADVITRVDANVVNLTYSHLSGSLLFHGSLPITGATVSIQLPMLSHYRSLNFFGRSANIAVGISYGAAFRSVGNTHGWGGCRTHPRPA